MDQHNIVSKREVVTVVEETTQALSFTPNEARFLAELVMGAVSWTDTSYKFEGVNLHPIFAALEKLGQHADIDKADVFRFIRDQMYERAGYARR